MEREEKPPVDDKSQVNMIGHMLIRDKDTQEVLLNQRDDFVQQDTLGNKNAR
jgi:hypothetical protein